MQSADDIKRLIDKAQITSSCQVDRRILSDALEDLEKRRADRLAHRPGVWRSIMRTRMGKLAAAALVVVGLLVTIQQLGGFSGATGVAWGDMREAFLRQHWVHLKYDNGEERWSNLQTGDSYCRQWDGRCVAVHYARNIGQLYDPEWGRHILEHPSASYPGGAIPPWKPETAWESVLGHLEQMAERGKRGNWDVERHPDQTNGVSSVRFDCYYHDAAGRRLLITKIWADPQTRLPLTIWERLSLAERNKQKREAITGTFDFPETGPGNIYDLGVSRDLPVVRDYDKVATPFVQTVVAAAQAAQERFPARYLVVVWDNIRVSQVEVVWRDGKRIRQNHYFSNTLHIPATAQDVLNWAQTQTPAEIYLFEGTKTYSRHHPTLGGPENEDGARVMRDTIGLVPLAARPIEEQWSYAKGNPASLERIEDAPRELSKYIGLRTNAGDIRREYYVDPEHDYLCVRNIWWKQRAGQWVKEREYEYSDLTRLPQGQWYATKHILAIYPEPGPDAYVGRADWNVHVQLLEEADFPADTFNGEKLLEGAKLETY